VHACQLLGSSEVTLLAVSTSRFTATHLPGLGQEQDMDSTTSSQRKREQRFQEIYDSVYLDLLRFVRRRVHPTHAEDVVGDVMLVAWRRLEDVPTDLSAARAWLFGVARKTLQNTRRRDNRDEAVAVRLAEVRHVPADAGEHPDLIAHRVDIAAAWPRLSALHQEAIALSVLDGLTAPEAAAVLGISSTAFRLRLSRARRSLRHHVGATTAGDRIPGQQAFDRSPR
jgi:RNA polymerase sigma-70 factor (ECF subfamily)